MCPTQESELAPIVKEAVPPPENQLRGMSRSSNVQRDGDDKCAGWLYLAALVSDPIDITDEPAHVQAVMQHVHTIAPSLF